MKRKLPHSSYMQWKFEYHKNFFFLHFEYLYAFFLNQSIQIWFTGKSILNHKSYFHWQFWKLDNKESTDFYSYWQYLLKSQKQYLHDEKLFSIRLPMVLVHLLNLAKRKHLLVFIEFLFLKKELLRAHENQKQRYSMCDWKALFKNQKLQMKNSNFQILK